MNPNILISASEKELEDRFGNDFIAHIDGNKVSTLRQFYEEIADLLDIPDFGYNLEALNDSLNDLQWLEDERVVIYFTATENFINKERDPAKIGSVLNVLDATAEDWKWSDDEPEEKKEIVLVFEDSSRIRKLLDVENIDYVNMANLS